MSENAGLVNPGLSRISAHTESLPDRSSLKDEILRHIQSTLGIDPSHPDRCSCFMGLAYALRYLLIERWIRTERALNNALR